jgi:hypothetical protein
MVQNAIVYRTAKPENQADMSSQSFHVPGDCFFQLIEPFGLQIKTQCALFELFNRAARVMIQCAHKRNRYFQVDSGSRDAALPVASVAPHVKLDYSMGVFFSDVRGKVRVEV